MKSVALFLGMFAAFAFLWSASVLVSGYGYWYAWAYEERILVSGFAIPFAVAWLSKATTAWAFAVPGAFLSALAAMAIAEVGVHWPVATAFVSAGVIIASVIVRERG